MPKRGSEDGISVPGRAIKAQRREELHTYSVFGHRLHASPQDPWTGALIGGGTMVTEAQEEQAEAELLSFTTPPSEVPRGDEEEAPALPRESEEDKAILAGLKKAADEAQESDVDEASSVTKSLVSRWR